MWFLVALFIGGFLLTALMSPKVKVQNAKASTLDDFRFPRAGEGDPLPRVYGTVKLSSPNTIALADFKAEPIKKKVKTGMFSSKKQITGYKYYSTIDLAWCLGPDVVFRRMWFADNLVWAGCLYGAGCHNDVTINLPELYGGSKDGNRGGIGGTVAMYSGCFDQERDAYLAAHIDADVPAYVGIAHTVFRAFWWGNSPSIDTVSVEVAYHPNNLAVPFGRHIMPNGLDMNAVAVLYDIFADDWGNLGYTTGDINTASWLTAAQTIYNEGLGMSLVVSSPNDAQDIVEQILRLIHGTLYEDQTTGLVELVLLRHDYDVDDLPVLDPSNVVEIRNFTKKLWNETNNVVRVKYTDRADNYAKDKVAVAKDSSLLRYQGKQRPVELTMATIYDAEVANAVAARELSNVNVPLYAFDLVANRSAGALKPGAAFALHWPEFGIERVIMRVRKPDYGTLESGSITLSVVQDEFSVDATVVAAPVPSEYTPTSLSPLDIIEGRIIELPALLDYKAALGTRAGYSRLAALLRAPSSYTLGFDAYVEQPGDDATVLSTAPYARTAQLVDVVERFAGWTTGVIASIRISNVSDAAALPLEDTPRQCGGLILIGDELLNYEGYAAESGGVYTLTNVHRAFLDTGWFSHEAGSRIYFIEGQESFFESDSLTGAAADIYATDRTATGSSGVSTAFSATVTPVGRNTRVVAPDYATADGSRDLWQSFNVGDSVSIDARPRNRNDVVEAWFETDAASAPEAGTTYKIETETDGVVSLVEDDVSLPYALTTTDSMTGQIVVLVSAKKDGLYSIAACPMPIVVEPANGSLRMTEGGDQRYLENDDYRITED